MRASSSSATNDVGRVGAATTAWAKRSSGRDPVETIKLLRANCSESVGDSVPRFLIGDTSIRHESRNRQYHEGMTKDQIECPRSTSHQNQHWGCRHNHEQTDVMRQAAFRNVLQRQSQESANEYSALTAPNACSLHQMRFSKNKSSRTNSRTGIRYQIEGQENDVRKRHQSQ